MNGNKYLFDTNALINFLVGHPNLEPFTDERVCVSIISIVEFLSFSGITERDKVLLSNFIKEIEVVDLTLSNSILINQISEIRVKYKLKLPDTIIAATAININAVLVTNDTDFNKIASLQILNY